MFARNWLPSCENEWQDNDDGLIMLLLFPVLAPHLHLEERSCRLGMR